MPLADDPQAFILRMFELESREGRGAFCVSYPDGVRPPEVPLDDGELIYGIYKSKYHYSPRSLTIVGENRHSKVLWSQIAHCSTKHGDGSKVSTLTLSDGSTVNISIGEFVTGWAGRTSQLF